MAKKPKTIIAYKGFNADWKCRDYQYEVGKTYTHKGDVEACESGFHACEAPFDVWGYYGPFESKFALVELSGETHADGKDTKIAAAELTVKAELTMPEFIKAGIRWLTENTKDKNDSGRSAQIGSSGDYAKIGSSGYSAQIGSSGDYAQSGSSGDYAKIGSSGRSAQIGSSGRSAQIGSSGDYAKIGSSGRSAQIGSSGHSAQIGSSGDYAQIGTTGYKSVIASSGYNAKVKGANGTHIAVAEYVEGECVGFATGCIGTKGLKADTWYRAKNLTLVEAA